MCFQLQTSVVGIIEVDRLIADRHSLEDLLVLEWLVLIEVWIAPQPDLMSGFGSAGVLIAWNK